MSLPDAWVDRIFSKLTLTYGAAFMRAYDGLPLDEVKANWGHELAGFQQCPSAIAYGLEHLPAGKAPNVLEFRELCRREPARAVALPAPAKEPVSPEVARATRETFRRSAFGGNRGWADRLRNRELAGEKLSLFQRQCWREALGVASPIEEAA